MRQLIFAVVLLSTSLVSLDARAQPAKLDLKYIPNDAVAVVVARPRAMLMQPSMELMPTEVITAAGIHHAGIDPLDIDEFVLIVGQPTMESPPGIGFVARLAKPYAWEKIAEKVRAAVKEFGFTAGGMADPQTLVMAQPAMVEAMRSADGTGDGPLLETLRSSDKRPHLQVVVSLDAAREFIDQAMQTAPKVPPPLDQFLKAPELASAVQIGLSLEPSIKLDLLIDGRDEAAAEELERLANMGLLMGKQVALTELAKEQQPANPEDPVQIALQQYMRRLVDTLFDRLTPARNGNRVAVHVEADTGMATTGVAVALLLPAVQAAREAARRTQSTNNLKQLAIAMHNYHAVYRQFPGTAIRDEDGKALLSWRVAILPFLEQKQLYEEFHLDEPWDSDHNKKLIERMPAVYANPNLALPGKTNYLAISGDGTALDGARPTIANVTDGTVNTVLFVEADKSAAIEWTKPADWQFDPQQPKRELGGLRPGGFVAAFVDGSVIFIANNTDPAVLRGLMTARGGEAVRRP